MLTETHVTQGEPLLSYKIASSNMRYIEINEREIYLRHDPRTGIILLGEVPQCGPDCNANLSQMLLEYTMSCEDCRDHIMSAKLVDQFGNRLGEELLARLYGSTTLPPDIDHVSETMDIILNSMGAVIQKDRKADHLRYDLAHCPIHEAASKSGLNLWVATARRAFIALCNYVVHTLASEWNLVQPTDPESDAPLDIILFAKK